VLQVELETFLKKEICSRLGSEMFIKEVHTHTEFYHVDRIGLGIFSSAGRLAAQGRQRL